MSHQQVINTLCSVSPEPLIVIKPEGNILGANHGICDLLGFHIDEINHKSILDLLPAGEVKRFCMLIESYLDHGQLPDRDLTFNLLDHQSKQLGVRLDLKPFELDNQLFFSSRIKVTNETNDRAPFEQTFKSVLDHMLQGIQIVDFDWKYLYLNREAEKHSRFRNSQLMGKTMMEVYPGIEDTELFQTLLKCKDDQKTRVIENNFTYPDGTSRWFQLSIQPFFSRMVIHSVDITELKTSQQKLIEKNKALIKNQKDILKSKSKLLGTHLNPHFIFNAMNSIQYYALNKDTEQVINFTSNFSRLMRSVLNNSLHLYIPLEEEIRFLEEYLKLEQDRLQNKFSYTISVAAEIDPGEIRIPPMLLQPYVENTIVHGIGHLDKGGVIEINFTKQRDLICCCIKDNGIGRTAASQLKAKHKTDHKSLGTELTESRLNTLQKLSDKKYRVHIEDIKDDTGNAEGTIVSVLFPLIH